MAEVIDKFRARHSDTVFVWRLLIGGTFGEGGHYHKAQQLAQLLTRLDDMQQRFQLASKGWASLPEVEVRTRLKPWWNELMEIKESASAVDEMSLPMIARRAA